VYKLLDQADELGFDAVEIDMLREKAEAIEEFKDRANKALNEAALNTLPEYTELIDEGKSLNVDLPALDTLERIVDQLRWIEKAKELSDVYLTLNEVTEIMEAGERCGISFDDELMRGLALRRDRGRWWEGAASHLLSTEVVPFEALEKLLDDATDLSVHKETYDKVDSIIIKTREARQSVQNLMSRVTPTGVNNQPPLSEARKLLKVVDELPVRPADSINFRKSVFRCEEWVKRGKKLFGKTSASIHQLEDHLLFALARGQTVFDVNDVPKREGSASPHPDGSGVVEAKDSEDGPYCICRCGPTGDMIECDKCKEWYAVPF
jgi:histone demethylase JARID1